MKQIEPGKLKQLRIKSPGSLRSPGLRLLQGLAIGMGIQKNFSVEQVVGAAFAAGTLGAGAAVKGSQQALMELVLKSGMVNVAQQLTLMALGRQSQFNVGSVVTSMLSTGMDMNLGGGFKDPFTRSMFNSVSSSAINGAINGKISIEEMAMSALGSATLSGVSKLAEQMQPGKTLNQTSSATQSSESHEQPKAFPQRRTATPEQLAIERARMHALMDAEDLASMDLDKMLDPRINVNDSQLAYGIGSEIGDRTTRLQRYEAQTRSPVSGNAASFFNQRKTNISDYNMYVNNTSGGQVIRNDLMKLGQELINPERLITSTADYIGDTAEGMYSTARSNLRTAYSEGIKTYQSSSEMLLKYGHIEEVKQFGQQMEHYFAELDREYLKSYGTKALSYTGKLLNGYELAEATSKVKEAWQTQGIGEAGWVAAHEYGGLAAGTVGAGLALAGALFVLPEAAVGFTVMGAVVGIGARVGGSAIGETGWKTWIESKHDFHDEVKETDKRFSM